MASKIVRWFCRYDSYGHGDATPLCSASGCRNTVFNQWEKCGVHGGKGQKATQRYLTVLPVSQLELTLVLLRADRGLGLNHALDMARVTLGIADEDTAA